MSIQSIPVNIDGMKFNIQQFKFRDAIKLEAQTLSILAPGLDLLSGFDGLDSEIDLGDLGNILKKILFTLRDEDPFEYIKSMTVNTFYNEKVQLNTDDAIDEIFHGKTITCMKLLFEIMKVNKFAFIEGLVGNGLNIIGTLKSTGGSPKNRKGKLENLEN